VVGIDIDFTGAKAAYALAHRRAIDQTHKERPDEHGRERVFPRLSFSLLCFSLLWRRANAWGQCAAAAASRRDYLDQNATILTVSHGKSSTAAILIRDGKIAEVGASPSKRQRMRR